ncbi:MAG: hypothetical protein ABFR32_12125 [Bacteroidota bacterium]
MKKILLILSLLASTLIYSQEDYQIEINGELTNIELDKNYEIKIKNKILNLKVSMKDTLTYNDKFISFKYPKEYKIASTKVEEGIEQLMLMTAEGSGFIIQKYMTMDPSMLNELMINEVTKESVNYGFIMKREDYDRTLNSGTKLKVNRAVLTYKDEINIYEIASLGKKDEGILIMTLEMDDMENSEGKKLIEMIWKTFEIH